MGDIRILHVDDTSRASFQVPGASTLQVSGIAHLVQVVVNHLMTTPGSDRLSPHRGAGLADLCRKHRTNSERLQEKIVERLERVESQIRDEQKQLNLPSEERLRSLSLVSATPDEDRPTQLNIIIGIQSETGDATQVTL